MISLVIPSYTTFTKFTAMERKGNKMRHFFFYKEKKINLALTMPTT